jgi:hypothetical protein
MGSKPAGALAAPDSSEQYPKPSRADNAIPDAFAGTFVNANIRPSHIDDFVASWGSEGVKRRVGEPAAEGPLELVTVQFRRRHPAVTQTDQPGFALNREL